MVRWSSSLCHMVRPKVGRSEAGALFAARRKALAAARSGRLSPARVPSVTREVRERSTSCGASFAHVLRLLCPLDAADRTLCALFSSRMLAHIKRLGAVASRRGLPRFHEALRKLECFQRMDAQPACNVLQGAGTPLDQFQNPFLRVRAG